MGDVSKWKDHVTFICERAGLNSKSYVKNIKLFNTKDLPQVVLKQNDSYNCGPISCMVIWYIFKPDDAPLSEPIGTFRHHVVSKLTAMSEDLIQNKKLLCKMKKNDFIKAQTQEKQSKK